MTDIDRIIAAGFVFFALICTVCVLCFILVHLYMHFKNRIAKLEKKNEKLQGELHAKEKKLSEIRAADNERFNYFNAIFTTMKDGIVVLSGNGEPILVNPAARDFLHIDKRIFLKNDTSFYGNFYAETSALCMNVYKTGRDETFEYSVEDRFFSVSAFRICDRYKPSVYLGVLALISDISEARRVEQRRKEFVRDVSHEFRTPMTLISGYAQMLRMWDEVTHEERTKALDIIEQETKRLKKLVSELLTLSAADRGENEEKTESTYVDIEAVIDQIIWTMEDAAARKSIKLISDVKLDYPLLRANEQFMYQMLLNLIDNAVTYNKEGGSVHICAHNNTEKVFITVADTGKGMREKHCKRIFEPFYRIDQDRNSGSGGTGIGLSIVARIVQRMKGTVSVKSEPEKGSIFCIELPI